MRFFGGFLFLIACQSSRSPQLSVQVAVRGVKQALTDSALGNANIVGASLAIACSNGEQQTATPANASFSPIIFTTVDPCGQADLTLTVQVATPTGSATGFVGTASANLVPGEVDVNFIGSVAGDLLLQPLDGFSWMCTIADQVYSVPPNGFTVSLPAGTYTVDCTSQVGNTASQQVTVVGGNLTTFSFPGATGNALLQSLSVTPKNAQVNNGFVFAPATMEYSQTMPLHAQQLSVNALPQSATATVSVNGQPATSPVAFAGASLDLDIVVADGSASNTYVVHLSRGAQSDDALLAALTLMPSEYSPIFTPRFSASTFSYAVSVAALDPASDDNLVPVELTPDDQTNLPAVTVNGQSVTYTLGNPVTAAQEVTLLTGANTVAIHSVAADGFSFADYTLSVPQAAIDPTDASILGIQPSIGALQQTNSNPLTYTLVVSARHLNAVYPNALTITVEPTQESASVAMELNASEVSPFFALNLTPGATNTLSIVVSASQGGASTPATINIIGGLLNTDTSALQTTAFGIGYVDSGGAETGFNPQVFYYPGNADGASCTVSAEASDPSVKITANGQAPGATLPLGPGVNPILVEATAPGGETDSYFLSANEADGSAAELVALVSAKDNTIALQQISSNVPQTIASDSTQTRGGITQPTAVAASITGHTIYYVGTGGIGWSQVSGAGFGAGFGSVPLPSGNAPSALAVDPKGRCVFVLDGGAVDTFALGADESLSYLSTSGNINASGLASDASGAYVYTIDNGTSFSIELHEVAPNGAVSPTIFNYIGATSSPLTHVLGDSAGLAFYFTDASNFYAASVGVDQGTFDAVYGEIMGIGNAVPLSNPVAIAVAGNADSDEDYPFALDDNGVNPEYMYANDGFGFATDGSPGDLIQVTTHYTAPSLIVNDASYYYMVAFLSGAPFLCAVPDSTYDFSDSNVTASAPTLANPTAATLFTSY